MRDEYINQLKALNALLNKEINYDILKSYSLSKAFSKMPSEICNLFKESNKINKSYGCAFLGCRVLSEIELIAEYQRDEYESFFGAYKYKHDFQLEKNYEIFFNSNPDEGIKEDLLIDDLEYIVPLCKFQGDYIVVDLGDKNFGALLEIVDANLSGYLAPSITEHIDDLIIGLERSIYKVTENDIIYPNTWSLRKKCKQVNQ